MNRTCGLFLMAVLGLPALAETGLLDPQGREITLERLWDRVSAAPTRDPDFNVDVWQDEADLNAARATQQPRSVSTAIVYPPSEPLTEQERARFSQSVVACWLAPDEVVKSSVSVTVGFALDPQGHVIGDVVLLAASLRNEALTLMAYQSARLAILRCQRTGYALPVEKYERWQDVEMTFDPAQMAMR